MLTIGFEGQKIECEAGDNLRKVLLKNRLSPYNGVAAAANCHGLGTCGTCAVKIEGPVSKHSLREKIRMSLPPHSPGSGLRLSCQTKVLGDLKVVKFAGLCGQEVGKARNAG